MTATPSGVKTTATLVSRAVAYRQLRERKNVGILIIYPQRARNDKACDGGLEFFGRALTKELLEDEEWARWFESRCVEWENE